VQQLLKWVILHMGCIIPIIYMVGDGSIPFIMPMAEGTKQDDGFPKQRPAPIILTVVSYP
jgi:hypothetical protein